ncbi:MULTISPECIES: peptide ABC transporter substrate-binding protein [Bacillus]|uniref:peptide ABC transporter substrate-binding protein n=1 Tax=Bacillus TaxID=1386 RepID=UPI00031DEC89|nr:MULTISPECIES: peptide ABC transporter substrate-binding protein [Bacillus]
MKKSKLTLLLVLTLVLSLFLAACSGDKTSSDNNSTEKPKEKEPKSELAENQELRVLESSEIPSMDSAMAQDEVSFTMLASTQEGLYIQDAESKLIPGVAEGEPEANAEGTEFTVKIKQGLTWANGEPLTAKDFVFSWKRAVDPKTASPYGPYMMNGKLKGAQAITDNAAAKKPYNIDDLGVQAVDDNTLKVTMEKPMTVEFFKGLMAFGTFMPQNEKFVTEQGAKFATTAASSLSNGPFKLTEWEGPTATKWVIEKNDKYHGAKDVVLTKISFNVVKDPQTSVNLIETGEADISGKLASDIVPQYEGDERMISWLDPSVFWLKMNQKNNPALKNLNIRKAIAMGFNKEDLATNVLNNGSIPANYAVPSDFVKDENGKDFRDANGDMLTYNVEEAKKAWEAGLKELGKSEVEIRYLGGDTETSKKIDQYMKNQLETNLKGLKIKLESVPFAVRLDRDVKQDYDLQAAGWGPDYLDPISFSDLWITDGGNNKMSYSNPEYDKLIKESQNTSDQAKRWEALQKAEKILLEEDAAIAPIYQRAANMLVNPKVQGFNHHGVGPNHSFQFMSMAK